MEFDFDFFQRAGVKHNVGNALLQPSTNETDDRNSVDGSPVLAMQRQTGKEKHALNYNCQDCDDTAVTFEQYAMTMAKAIDVQISATTDFRFAQSKDVFCNQIKTTSWYTELSFYI